MIDIELRRKALEASGWKIESRRVIRHACTDPTDLVNRTFILKPNGGIAVSFNTDAYATTDVAEFLPAVEHDPRISEPWFLAWCEKHNFEWSLQTCNPHDQWAAPHIVLWIANHELDVDFEVEGATMSECRAKAVIASNKAYRIEVPR